MGAYGVRIGTGVTGNGDIASDINGGFSLGSVSGGEGGTAIYREVASNVDCLSIAGSGASNNSSAAIDGEVCGILSVIGYPDGTDGKGAGAGDGEALLRGYDGGKGVGALEDQGAVGQGGFEREGLGALEVIQGNSIAFRGYGGGAAVSISNSFALL